MVHLGGAGEISVVDLDDLVPLQELARTLRHPPGDESRDEDPGPVPPSHQTETETSAGLPCQADREVLVEDGLRTVRGLPLEEECDLVLSAPQLVQSLRVGQLGEVHRIDFSNPITRLQFGTLLCWAASVDLVDEDSDLEHSE